MTKLAPQQVAAFRSDGFLFPVPAIGADAARRYRDCLETHERDSAMLVRGKDKYGNFDAEARPGRDLDDAALAAHADAVGRQVANLYKGTTKNEFRA